jgi:hypothetical protein
MNIPQPPIREPINGLLQMGWLAYFTQLTTLLSGFLASNAALPNFVNDAAAKVGGVPLNGYYRNGSIVMQRVV